MVIPLVKAMALIIQKSLAFSPYQWSYNYLGQFSSFSSISTMTIACESVTGAMEPLEPPFWKQIYVILCYVLSSPVFNITTCAVKSKANSTVYMIVATVSWMFNQNYVLTATRNSVFLKVSNADKIFLEN